MTQTNIPNFYRATLCKHCDSPVFVRMLVRERETARCQVVQRDPRRDVVVHAAYCYRRAAVARSDNPRGLLLLGLWSNNRVANVQALPCFSSFVIGYGPAFGRLTRGTMIL